MDAFCVELMRLSVYWTPMRYLSFVHGVIALIRLVLVRLSDFYHYMEMSDKKTPLQFVVRHAYFFQNNQ